jgi:nitrous oxidase accessory protein NosD
MVHRSASIVLLTLLISLWLGSGPAAAAMIQVVPGPGTPLQDAINAATAGDTIAIGAGTYPEAIVVDKPLRLRGPDPGVNASLVWLDPGCAADTGLEVAADDVTVERIGIVRTRVTAVSIHGHDRVRMKKVAPRACGGDGCGCGTEQYGFDVFQSTRVRLTDGIVYGSVNGVPGTTGFAAGMYFHGIAPLARVLVRNYFSSGNLVGVLVEDSTGPAAVAVTRLAVAAHDTGIFLRNADRVRVLRNVINDAAQASPNFGIRLDAASDENGILMNHVSGYVTDVQDEGTGNCWHGNMFTTGSVPAGGCY